MNIFVGNLPYSMTDQELRTLFEAHGQVDSAKVIMDWDTGRSRGFGFVEMGNEDEAQAAIEALNGQAADGRPLTVNQARPRGERRERREPRGGGGGFDGGGGGGGGGGGDRGGDRW